VMRRASEDASVVFLIRNFTETAQMQELWRVMVVARDSYLFLLRQSKSRLKKNRRKNKRWMWRPVLSRAKGTKAPLAPGSSSLPVVVPNPNSVPTTVVDPGIIEKIDITDNPKIIVEEKKEMMPPTQVGVPSSPLATDTKKRRKRHKKKKNEDTSKSAADAPVSVEQLSELKEVNYILKPTGNLLRYLVSNTYVHAVPSAGVDIVAEAKGPVETVRFYRPPFTHIAATKMVQTRRKYRGSISWVSCGDCRIELDDWEKTYGKRCIKKLCFNVGDYNLAVSQDWKEKSSKGKEKEFG